MKKRILSILLVACMLLAVIPMTVSAETINTPTTEATGAPQYEGVQNTAKYYKTVYISAEGNDANNGSQAAPVATLTQAFKLLAEGGELVVLTDISVIEGNTNGTPTVVLSKNTAPIYIHSASGENKKLNFTTSRTASKTTNCMVVFQGDVVIYDIDLTTNCTSTWFLTSGCNLTIGTGVTTATTREGDTNTNYRFDICGGQQSTTDSTGASWYSAGSAESAPINTTINIYSGTWDRITPVTYQLVSSTPTLYQNGTLNIYGGTVDRAITVHNGSKLTNFKGSATVNCYAGTVNSVHGSAETATAATHCLNVVGASFDITSDTFIPATYLDNSNKTNVISTTATVTNTLDINNAAAFDSTITPNFYSVRFVATFTGEISAYDKVGFKVTVGTDDYSKECAKVYTSVAGDSASITAAALGGDYIFALAIKDIPTSAGEVTFTVTPYTVAAGQTDEVLGTAYTVTYNAGVYSAN